MYYHLHLSAFLLGLAYQVTSCQLNEPWKLRTKNHEVEGSVAFKNVTTAGKHQSLAWIWSESNSESWENKVGYSDATGVIEGSVIYRNNQRGEKKHVHIQWKLVGDDFTSVNSNKRIFNSTWSITTWNGLNIEFNSNKEGIWELTVLDKYTITNGEEYRTAALELDITATATVSRKKRSDEENSTSEFPDIQQAGIMDCLFDFLFGEGDPIKGESGGIFTRMKSWFHGISCRIRGNCEDTNPIIPTFPTMPPFNPDAEDNPETLGKIKVPTSKNEV